MFELGKHLTDDELADYAHMAEQSDNHMLAFTFRLELEQRASTTIDIGDAIARIAA